MVEPTQFGFHFPQIFGVQIQKNLGNHHLVINWMENIWLVLNFCIQLLNCSSSSTSYLSTICSARFAHTAPGRWFGFEHVILHRGLVLIFRKQPLANSALVKSYTLKLYCYVPANGAFYKHHHHLDFVKICFIWVTNGLGQEDIYPYAPWDWSPTFTMKIDQM